MINLAKRRALIVAFAMACITSCTHVPASFNSPPTGASATAVFYARWVEYLQSIETEKMQADCMPRLIEPNSDVPYRGTVVLLHAFTACPQQFVEISELLALQGYRTMLMLLPGHGHDYSSAGSDNLGDLPVPRNWHRQYASLADRINGIMRFAAGERIIGGHSAGAVASLFVQLQSGDLYDRQLLFAPYFAPIEPMVDPQLQQEFRYTCLANRGNGRAGYCDFEQKHRDAMAALGSDVLNQVADTPSVISTQVVAIRKDRFVEPAGLNDFLAREAGTHTTAVCYLPEDVPHAMISQFDNRNTEMYWLDSVLNGAIRFITAGHSFPVIDDSLECALETERRD
jgi:hypothetical protein